ncbi:related to thioesterase [Rhynchosporium secalis]|uniref:Related to thioesterase n=1 Tax=Rhynchosporium secalis TaxID=38038 RepID=A0A1E1M4V1_RHYSE|nr:related to thioesterase [Rhynchosporium secalis]
MATRGLKQRRRDDYGYILEYRTRWSDNDMYDHMNNSIYNFLYDSVINTYLIKQCGLHPPSSSQYGLAVHSHVDFFGSIAFPAVADLALRVNKLGKTSVTYEAALFERGIEEVKSVGEMVHVFVDRESGRPVASGMNATLKEGLQKILVTQAKL